MLPPELAPLLAAVSQDLDSDAPRLAVADALEARGEAARAELIRKQCALAQMAPGSPQRVAAWPEIKALLDAHAAEWLAPLGAVARARSFWRGFLNAVEGSATSLLAHGDALALEPAIEHVHLGGDEYEAELTPEVLARFGELAFLRRLRSVELDDGFPVGLAAQLLALPALAGLRAFTVRDGSGFPTGAAALAAAVPSALRTLSLVGFMGTDFGDDAARALADSPTMAKLEHLRLWNCNLREDGARAVGASPHLAQLRSLWLGLGQYTLNKVGPAGCRALAALERLETLDLDFNDITDEGWLAFVERGRIARLRELRLQACKLTDASIAPMLAQPAPALVTLDLSHNALGTDTCRALAAASLPALRTLWLYANPLGRAGLVELLRAPWLGQLEELNLDSTNLTAEDVLTLARAPATATIARISCELPS